MAQATHTPAVTRTKVVEIKPAVVTLHLSMEEASALLAVCRCVGGSPSETRRRHLDSINLALDNAGVANDIEDIDPRHCYIYFMA